MVRCRAPFSLSSPHIPPHRTLVWYSLQFPCVCGTFLWNHSFFPFVLFCTWLCTNQKGKPYFSQCVSPCYEFRNCNLKAPIRANKITVMQNAEDESQQLEYIATAMQAVLLIFFPCKSRPDPARQLLGPALLTLLVCPDCHGLGAALGCGWNALSLAECPAAWLQDQASALDPRSKHTGSAFIRWMKWHLPPSPGVILDEQWLCTYPLPFFPRIPCLKSSCFTPAAPWVFLSLQCGRSWPLVLLNTNIPRPLQSPAVWAKSGITHPKCKQADSSATLKLLRPIITLNACRLSQKMLSQGTKQNQLPFHDLPDGCEEAAEAGLSVSIKETKSSSAQRWTARTEARC